MIKNKPDQNPLALKVFLPYQHTNIDIFLNFQYLLKIKLPNNSMWTLQIYHAENNRYKVRNYTENKMFRI
jgi:hypothetical protein